MGPLGEYLKQARKKKKVILRKDCLADPDPRTPSPGPRIRRLCQPSGQGVRQRVRTGLCQSLRFRRRRSPSMFPRNIRDFLRSEPAGTTSTSCASKVGSCTSAKHKLESCCRSPRRHSRRSCLVWASHTTRHTHRHI